ncbi:hypothetical protein PHSC3_000039 [Chlamydiales bacterium STE3]|nr:hypothetical protein PHSC3_000039 [Chlamydiales bacterium STE3]
MRSIQKILIGRTKLMNKFNDSQLKYKRFLPIGLALSAFAVARTISILSKSHFKGITHLA